MQQSTTIARPPDSGGGFLPSECREGRCSDELQRAAITPSEGRPVVLISTPASARSEPVTHAFIVGVSRYPFADGAQSTDLGRRFEITNLSTAARSASQVAAWLLDSYCNPHAPLATIRILLSPADGERLDPRIAQRLGAEGAPATRDTVETEFYQFSADCRANHNNHAVVYVAGHGAQLTKHQALVLLEDFGVGFRNALHGAIDVAACHAALTSRGGPDRQLWLVDACRQRPGIARRFETMYGAFTPSTPSNESTESPIPRTRTLLLAASQSERAYAVPGESTVFSQGLLAGLNGAAAISPRHPHCDQWHVSPTSLHRFVAPHVNGVLADTEAEQTVDLAELGADGDVAIHRLSRPPDVDIVVNLNPADAQPAPRHRLLLHGEEPPVAAADTWPLVYRGQAGIYTCSVTVEPPLRRNAPLMFLAEPPQCVQSMEVSR